MVTYVKEELIHSSAVFTVNSSNQTYHSLKRRGFRWGLDKSTFGNSYRKLKRQAYSGATAENMLLTANQIVYANNEVMMVNLRDTWSESLSGKGGIYLYERIGFQLILYKS